jgi:hypothetical protein
MNAMMTSSLLRFAAQDLRAAKAHGYLLIGQTNRGTLSLSYTSGTYTLSTTGTDATVLAEGKPAAVRPVLARLYTIA